MERIELLAAIIKAVKKDEEKEAEQPVDSEAVESNIIIKRKLWDSDAEEKVFQCLQDFINTDNFYIVPHILVSEVIKNFKEYEYWKDTYKKYCELAEEERKDSHFELTHFDFVIYNKADYSAVLIIEVDGSAHKRNLSTIHFDRLKNFIAEKYYIPLVRLELHNANVDIEEELKKELKAVSQKLNDPSNYPIFCWRCGKKFIYQTKAKENKFFYCDSCQKRTGKNVTVSYNEKMCPHLFVWDK